MKTRKLFFASLVLVFMSLCGCIVLRMLDSGKDSSFYHSPYEIARLFLLRPLFWLSVGCALGQIINFPYFSQTVHLVLAVFSIAILAVYGFAALYMLVAPEVPRYMNDFVIWCAQYCGIFSLPGIFMSVWFNKSYLGWGETSDGVGQGNHSKD